MYKFPLHVTFSATHLPCQYCITQLMNWKEYEEPQNVQLGLAGQTRIQKIVLKF
jgi:hypothetical protein